MCEQMKKESLTRIQEYKAEVCRRHDDNDG